MKLGIDFGTTRTLVACADRGNYPVVSFVDDEGDAHEHVPSVVADDGGRLRYGFDALAAARQGAQLVRSFKRALASADVTGATPVRVGTLEVPMLELLTGYLTHVREALRTRSNAPKKASADPTAAVAVPAHAHGAQRFITLEAFRAAGFDVTALLNEPSAAGFEYTHRQERTVTARRTRVVVYDLGGGTFDASLVKVDGGHHDVLATAGDNRLGGDDFDEALLALACARGGLDTAALAPPVRAALLDQCRDAKERITPQARRVSLDVSAAGGAEVVVTVEELYGACTPLVERTMAAMAPLLRGLDAGDDALTDIAGIYLVGGGSGLPLVARVLKERFGRRVHRSPYPAASTAIGLAIAADGALGFSLADRFSRCFGVFRERDGGRALTFDPIFLPDTAQPQGKAAVLVSRRYRAAHNLGHFRFVECSRVDEAGEPVGDVMPFGDVLFPFDPALRARTDLDHVPVERCQQGPDVEERYLIDPAGLVEVQIEDTATGFSRSYRLGRAAR
ncbi:MAG: Hsp70 family protein [Deltaproteobacteria bacterium]|nr:Hsp70 family protein [Deltaproteobacteria bacterium]